jgi:hypothetical protein
MKLKKLKKQVGLNIERKDFNDPNPQDSPALWMRWAIFLLKK